MINEDMSLNNFRSNLRILELEIEKLLELQSGCCGVSFAQAHLLMELGIKDGTSIKELSDALELDKSTLSRTIDGLITIGLLTRSEDKDDRRFLKINITPKGKKSLDLINKECSEYYKNLFKYIPEKKHKNVIEAVEILGSVMKRIRKSEDLTCCIKGDKK